MWKGEWKAYAWRAALPLAAALVAAFTLCLAARTHGAEPLRTRGGEVTALAPEGGGWSCAPESRTGDGFSLAEIRCSRRTGGVPVVLYAKDYAGPSQTVEAICARDWKEYLRSVLPEVSRAAANVVREGSRAVCVVDVEGRTSEHERLRVREWYAVAPRHVLLVSIAGPADLVTPGTPTIDRWRRGVVFAAVRP